ncbi:alpha/beta hydrolase family protein [Lysobacter terrae]
MKQLMLSFALLVGVLTTDAKAAGVDVDAYARKDKFGDIKISPGGEYYAASVPLDDRTILVVFERGTNKLSTKFVLPKNTHVAYFDWAKPDRLILGTAEKFGMLAEPQWTGELYAINANGGKAELLVGYQVDDGGPGTLVKPKKGNDSIYAFAIDAPPTDGKSVLVSIQPYGSSDPYSSAELLDIYSGRRNKVTSAPVRNASFGTDNQGVVRFAWGFASDNVRKLYYRAGDGAQWELLSVETNGRFDYPVGFSADNMIAYLRSEQADGPDAIVALTLATRERKVVLRDDDTDPSGVIYQNGTRTPVGFFFNDGKLRTGFIDEQSADARLYHSLEAAFAGEAVVITSRTADGRIALVQTYNDRNPGDFYLFDTVAKKASHILARSDWFDPEQQHMMQPIQLKARDGLDLHGYLTLPKGSSGKGLPLIVLPHGGPYGIRDVWGFDPEGQMLAQAGYAVLQLNYRGSSGYGRSFEQAGAQQWGGTMQDDLTDATRWAIEQGIADRNRICMYGASYGAYAALMGAAKEPTLYRCAVGYVGVYDLPKMQTDTNRDSARLGNWSKDWVGKREDLGAVSPNRLADRIKIPVFLAAGGEDKIAPIEHSKMMEAALRKTGTPVETLYYDDEGHGFYVEAHRREFYARLLTFLGKHLGGATAATTAAASTTGK